MQLELATDPRALALVSLLTEVAEKLAFVRSFEEMALAVVAVLDGVIDVEYTGFFLIDPESGRLRLITARGFSESERAEAERTAPDRHPGWVIRNAKMVHVADTETDEEKRTLDSQGRSFKVRSRLYVPVLSSRGCVGAYGLASCRPGVFSDSHIALLRYAASVTGAVYGSLANERQLSRQLDVVSQKQSELLLLSSPVIEVWDRTLALPIIGSIDRARAQYMAERLLGMVVSHRARTVILDFTGTAALGPSSLTELLRIVCAVELLGSSCVFSGVSPVLAKTLAQADQLVARIKSYASLKQALAARLTRQDEAAR